MEFEYCIPSKGRAGLITSKKIFKDARLFVPLSEVTQYSQYSNVIGVPNEIKGITATRNYILKSTTKNVFFIDDDLQFLGKHNRDIYKHKVERITDIETITNVVDKLFRVADQMKSKILGLHTTSNNLTNYPNNPFLFNGVCLGSCMGVINDGSYYFDEEFEVKEDYELSLRSIFDGVPTVKSNILFMQHEHTQRQGGCRDDRRIEKEKKAIKQLIKKYPGAIKQAKHRGTSFAIQLNL